MRTQPEIAAKEQRKHDVILFLSQGQLPFYFRFLCSSMAVFFASLNSGSNGNCYYIGNENEAILVDAGISCREIEKRMKQLELPIQKLKAVFISHEHGDHIKGLSVLAQKHQLPVYITSATLEKCYLNIEKEFIKSFSAEQRS